MKETMPSGICNAAWNILVFLNRYFSFSIIQPINPTIYQPNKPVKPVKLFKLFKLFFS